MIADGSFSGANGIFNQNSFFASGAMSPGVKNLAESEGAIRPFGSRISGSEAKLLCVHRRTDMLDRLSARPFLELLDDLDLIGFEFKALHSFDHLLEADYECQIKRLSCSFVTELFFHDFPP
jgi:hypothetical protein